MSSIKFNQLTKEIEMKGSESFIESNFNKIQDLLVESYGEKKIMISRKTKTSQEPISYIEMKKSQAGAKTDKHELTKPSPALPATKSSVPEFSHELNTDFHRPYHRQ